MDIVIKKLSVEIGEVKGERWIGVLWIGNGVSCIFVKSLNLVCVEIFSNSIYLIFVSDEFVIVKILLLILLGLGVEDLVVSKFSLYLFGLFLNFWDERLEFFLKFLKI